MYARCQNRSGHLHVFDHAQARGGHGRGAEEICRHPRREAGLAVPHRRLRRRRDAPPPLGFVDPDPAVDADTSQHIGVVLYGNDALDRWAACPALTDPDEIAKYVLWMDGRKSRG